VPGTWIHQAPGAAIPSRHLCLQRWHSGWRGLLCAAAHLFALGKLRTYVIAKLVVQVAVSHAGQACGRARCRCPPPSTR
jgi:hypothetical protein